MTVLAATALMFTACDDDDNKDMNGGNPGQTAPDPETITDNTVITASTAGNWYRYMQIVAGYLKDDATNLYDSWNTSYDGGDAYATIFKRHGANDPYKSAKECIIQIIDGCIDIASEVGQTKIGEPYDYWMAGSYTQAVYAVESWYSYHSRQDYQNNILSIRNSYYNSRNGQPSSISLCTIVKATDAALNDRIITAINHAANAIEDIPDPFRNNINTPETVAAMDACAELEDMLDKSLRNFIENKYDGNENDAELDQVVNDYVDHVILPTYKDLKDKNEALYQTVTSLAAAPSNEAFQQAAQEWLNARQPWEQSEAFLFGPVDALGLDPNMDSWPLDKDAIVNILVNGDFSGLNETDDEGLVEESSQNVRGFHTLEFLIYKDGMPRTVPAE